MPRVPFWQVDAFTDRPFAGNPAAVVWLDADADPAWMQHVATEMNLAETAFVQKRPDGDYDLRWFTPTVEVDLCGHATLASAHALWEAGKIPAGPTRFHTRSGVLTCTRNGHRIELDFPSTPPAEATTDLDLLAALGVGLVPYFGRSKFDVLLQLDSAAAVRAVRPDFRKLIAVPARGVIVTAASDDPKYDFISRFFAPQVGIDEDPVTGSAHCALAPYWSAKLGKSEMTGYQASARGGVVQVRVNGDRVVLSGHAVTTLEGVVRV
jgi:PhzF family phenazine biosynthesis protein